MKKRFRASGVLWGALALGLLWALTAYSGRVQDALRESILYSLTALVPSLFPYMAVTGLLSGTAAGEALGKLLSPLTRWVFRLPPCCAPAILLGLTGGYPAGAKAVSLLLEQGKIDRRDAARLLSFCVAPGLAFVVSYLGGSVLGDVRAGGLLFISVTLAAVLMGALLALGAPVPKKARAEASKMPPGILTEAVAGACKGVLLMCGCIAAFACLLAVLREMGLFGFLLRGLTHLGVFTPMEAAAVLSFLFEVTGGVGAAARFQVPTAFYAFGLGFGGLCVHLQVFALFRDFPMSRLRFCGFRLLQGLLAAGLYVLGENLLPGGPPVPAAAPMTPVLSRSPWGGLGLLVLSGAFLLTSGGRETVTAGKRETGPQKGSPLPR